MLRLDSGWILNQALTPQVEFSVTVTIDAVDEVDDTFTAGTSVYLMRHHQANCVEM